MVSRLGLVSFELRTIVRTSQSIETKNYSLGYRLGCGMVES
jgi:hypothetical protein